MQFDYFMQLANSSKAANILVRVGEDSTSWDTVYDVREQTSGWRRVYAHIGFWYFNFMIDILGHFEPGNSGSAVAIDNVQFLNCSFPPSIGVKGTCTNDQFKCQARGFCISKDLVCNFDNDCGIDSSDERNCTDYKHRCNFEETLASCGIGVIDTKEWTITSGKEQSVENYFPKIDNTRYE